MLVQEHTMGVPIYRLCLCCVVVLLVLLLNSLKAYCIYALGSERKNVIFVTLYCILLLLLLWVFVYWVLLFDIESRS